MRSPRIGSAFRCDPTNQFDFSCDSQRRKKFDGFANEVVEVYIFHLKRRLFQQTAHPPNDFTGAPVILQNILHDILEFRDVGTRRTQDRVCRFGVGQNSTERLVNFVSN